MKKVLGLVWSTLTTNPKVKAAEYALLLAVIEAIRSGLGHP